MYKYLVFENKEGPRCMDLCNRRFPELIFFHIAQEILNDCNL